jgi:hypothetical protein
MTVRTYKQQSRALTLALRSSNPQEQVLAECKRVIAEWKSSYWPDDWSRWQRALDDTYGLRAPRLDDL